MIHEDHGNKGNGGQEALIVKKFPWSIPKECIAKSTQKRPAEDASS